MEEEYEKCSGWIVADVVVENKEQTSTIFSIEPTEHGNYIVDSSCVIPLKLPLHLICRQLGLIIIYHFSQSQSRSLPRCTGLCIASDQTQFP